MRRIDFYRLNRTIKSPMFMVSVALIFGICCIYFNQPVSPEELRKSNFGESVSITTSPAIQQRYRTKKHVIKARSSKNILSDSIITSQPIQQRHQTKKHVLKTPSGKNISSDLIITSPIQHRNITHAHNELGKSNFSEYVSNITSPQIQERSLDSPNTYDTMKHVTKARSGKNISSDLNITSPTIQEQQQTSGQNISSNSIITSPRIQQRSLDSPNTYDIGILVIVDTKANLKEYHPAIDTLECYARLHNYGFQIEWVNNKWKKLCKQKQFMFIRHCIASNLLHRHDWTLFLDADVAVINPSRLIDTFVAENEKIADLVFYDRFFNWEIAAGSYLAKNSSYSKEFLMKFANMEFSLPRYYHGSDNGAIHWLFVQEFFGDRTSQFNPKDCHAIWRTLKGWDGFHVYEACCRLIMGETRLFHDPAGKGTIKLIPKGEGWMRDGWLTNTRWSLDSDFMLHGWKHSSEMPLINGINSSYLATNFAEYKWYRAIANPSFDLAACSNGTIQWQWWSVFMISKKEVQDLLMKRRLETREIFFAYQAMIPKFLKKIK